MITCFVHYEIDPFETEGFEAYARSWGQAIPRCGADPFEDRSFVKLASGPHAPLVTP